MIQGIDISHHNALAKIKPFAEKSHFIFMKATEGATYKDSMMDNWYRAFIKESIIPGFYHYARPENNTPDKEALNFFTAVRPYLENGALLALDWEGNAWKEDHDWIAQFMAEMSQYVTGDLMFYTSAYYLPKALPYLSNNGLWVADYSSPECQPRTQGHLWAIHQYTSNTIDQNWFNGTKEQLQLYRCWEKKSDNQEDGGCFCGCSCCS